MKKCILFMALLMAFTITGCGSSDAPPPPKEEKQQTETAETVKPEADSDSYFKDGTLHTDDLDIKITSSKYYPAGEYSASSGGVTFPVNIEEPEMVFYFDITNNTSKPMTMPSGQWSFFIKVTQAFDDYDKELNPGFYAGGLTENIELRDIGVNATINPGGTVSTMVSYIVGDPTKPVILTGYSNMFDSVPLGSMEYTVG